jgi:hypothetical protein
MNEIEQLRARLRKLDQRYINQGSSISPVWDVKHWQELDNIVDTLNLLDPCWVDEIPLNSYFTDLYKNGAAKL